MNDFEKRRVGDVVVIDVNIGRATLKEAICFRKFMDEELDKKCLKMIVDLSSCEFVDSSFIGALVVSLKKISLYGGELRLVEPFSIAHSILSITGTLNIFNVYGSIEEALDAFNKPVSVNKMA